MKVIDMLIRMEPFRCLSDKEISGIAGTFHAEKFRAGQELIHYGDIIRKIGLIEHGEVCLMSPLRPETMQMCGILSRGEFIVDAGILTNGRSTYSIYCKTHLRCHIQTKTDYIAMVNSYPNIKEYFYKQVLNQLVNAFGLLNGDPENTPGLGDEKLATAFFPRNIKKALIYIETNYTRDIKLDEIARVNGMSKYHFSRIFKDKTGFSFKEYLNNRRLERAKYLIKYEEMNITESAFAVGFNDVSYFSRLFQKKEGLSPSEYKKKSNHCKTIRDG